MPFDDKKIEEAFDVLDSRLELPESLSADSIGRLIKDEEQIKPAKKRFTKRSFAALAASLAVIIAAGVYFASRPANIELVDSQNNAQGSAPAAAVENVKFVFAGDDLKTFSSHRQIIQNAKKYAGRNRLYDIREEAAGVFNFGTKVDSAAPQDVNESASAAVGAAASTAESKDFGKTNVQISEVDEGDILKNDGRYLYYVACGESGDDGVIVIADCGDPKNLKETAKIVLPSEENEYAVPKELYIKDNLMAVLANRSLYGDVDENGKRVVSDAAFVSCCGFDPVVGTELYIYDISNKAEPKLVNRFSQDGGYIGSRLARNKIVFWSMYYADMSSLKAAEETCIPSTSDGKISADRIAAVENFDPNFVILTSFSLDGKEHESVSVCGSALEAYCTEDTLYLGCSEYSESGIKESFGYYDFPDDFRESDGVEITKIVSFDISDGINSNACGKVLGSPLGQFSIDEYGGHLRIATSAFLPGGQRTFVTVLGKTTLEKVGFLSDIAVGESLMSARFIENTGYLVTFYQTDPLFVIDLSNPAEPKITGELKIPGFSSYLHPIGDKLLLGVGSGGDEDGLNDTVKFSVFDVSDPAKPIEASVAVVENTSYLSMIDHKDFRILGKDTYAVPLYLHGLLTETENSVSMEAGLQWAVVKITGKEVYVEKLLPCSEAAFSRAAASYIEDAIFIVSGKGIVSYDRQFEKLDELKFEQDLSARPIEAAEETTYISKTPETEVIVSAAYNG